MIRKGSLGVLIVAMTVICAACWDRTEINDIALVMASSIDLDEDGRYSGSLQMAIPARQIGNTTQKSKRYFVESGAGNGIQQMIMDTQPKLSRRLFVAHRRVLFIGERLAKHGLKDIFDYHGRNPTTRLRTYVLVVKGGEGHDALDIEYPLEFVPTEAVREMELMVGSTAVTMRDLFAAASGEGIQPVLGVIELKPVKEKGKAGATKTFDLTGTAVFKDLKLVGYLNGRDTQLMLWVTGKLKDGSLAVELPGTEDTVNVKLTEAKRKISPKVENGKVTFAIRLEGKGTVEEDTSHLDFANPDNLHLVENELEKLIGKRMRKMIADVQKTYDSDIFGFGEVLHKKNNKAWRQLKSNWNETFAEAEFTIDTDFVVIRAGMTGPSLQLREQEVVK
ncbi:Ger(x)C family spore germination protein [Paenibacillus mesophilus]|uniref:Ger(x)C family spore germination protein n=1 Tax=Paenibacillus mesophilus TaxID=2582849 RepID=UPI00110E07BC|nr:Ger(x)C family spore germination protein [Paenibacillus mesophilus]TMV48034.1 Ger(x)C family spore germination protein [Paenibacillus mesophilus]